MLKNPAGLGTLDLNLLYTFRVFAECGSAKGTAERLGRSQPAISARLHQLEIELGVPLFVRRGRGLGLTPFGRSFYQRSVRVLGGLHELIDEVRASTERPSGVLRIGALPTVGVFLLAPRVQAYLERFPAVEVEMHYGLGRELLESYRRGRLDVVMGVSDPPFGELEVTVIGRAAPVLVVGRDAKPRLPRGTIKPSQISALALAAYGSIGDPFFDRVWSFLVQHRLESRVRLKVPHIQTLKVLAASRTFATILPDYTVIGRELETHRIEGLEFSEPIWIGARSSALRIPLIAELGAMFPPLDDDSRSRRRATRAPQRREKQSR